MPTTGKLSGTLWKISVAGTTISNLTTNSASFTNETRDTTTKDSAGWREFLSTVKTSTFSAEGLVALDALKKPPIRYCSLCINLLSF